MRARILSLLKRHGWNATSFQILGPGFEYWFSADGEAVVAYVDAGGFRVAAGAPVCAEERLAEVAAAFEADARDRGRRVLFFACEARLLRHIPGWDWMRIGMQATWDPQRWSENTPSASTVASQVRRASRKGVAVREVTSRELRGEERGLAEAMQRMVTTWTQRHRMAQMHFLVALESLTYTDEHRYFVAERDDRLVGLLVAIPVYARGGWMLENLIVDRSAPNGTGEALVDVAMRAFEREGSRYATMGLVALAGLDAEPASEPRPAQRGRIRKTLLNAVLRGSYDRLNWLYGFRGLYAFRSRFKPQSWEPIFMVSDAPVVFRSLIAVLLAFMGRAPGRFALQTLDRVLHRALRPSPREVWAGVSAFLSAALVPWIVALLSADSRWWFGSDWLALAWASFDIPVALAFGALAVGVSGARTWARPLARVLLGVVLADAWLTTTQALLYNVPRGHGGPVLWAAVAAPLAAAVYLVLLIRFVNLEEADDD